MEKTLNDNMLDEDTISVQEGINDSDDNKEESDGQSGTESDDQDGGDDQGTTSRYSMSYKNGKINKN